MQATDDLVSTIKEVKDEAHEELKNIDFEV